MYIYTYTTTNKSTMTNIYLTEASERDNWGQHFWGHCEFHVFRQRNFLGTPANLLLSSQKCQGVPFSPICQNS